MPYFFLIFRLKHVEIQQRIWYMLNSVLFYSFSEFLTHFLEDISAAADLAQQLAVGDGHVVVW